ncbi:MAG: cytochrome c3 family protein [Magnetococcales bacterium]|nr:cytochrome c3 family protein [Magnetococcales bacterium]
MNATIKIILLINMLIITILIIYFPHLMVAPGKLSEGHRALDQECFACHLPLTGAVAAKCISCHKVDDIGLRTTKGLPIAVQKSKLPFHQKLRDHDCVACHSDHQGVAKYRSRQRFSHNLLETADRARCESCHANPSDPLHATLSGQCTQCHGTDSWKASNINHDKLFLLDRNHNVRCTDCHTGGNYKQYTCYACHEHSPEKIRREHWKEGIRKFDNCVSCHRNANEDDAKRLWRSQGEGEKRHDDHHRRKHDDDN